MLACNLVGVKHMKVKYPGLDNLRMSSFQWARPNIRERLGEG